MTVSETSGGVLGSVTRRWRWRGPSGWRSLCGGQVAITRGDSAEPRFTPRCLRMSVPGMINMNIPSFQEDHISQVPALQLLQNLGYTYLRPQEVILQRRGRFSNVLLEGILVEQLHRMNRITYRGAQHEFTEANIQAAVQADRK